MSTVTIGVIVGIILLVLLLAFFMKRYLQTRRHRVRAATWKGSTMSCRKTTAGTKRKMPKLDEINRAYHEGGDCSAEGSDSLEWHMRHSGGSKQGSVTKALDKVRQTIGGKVPEHKMSLSRHDSAAEGMGRDNDDDLEMGTMPDAVRSRGHRGSLIAFTDGMAIPAPPAPPAIEPIGGGRTCKCDIAAVSCSAAPTLEPTGGDDEYEEDEEDGRPSTCEWWFYVAGGKMKGPFTPFQMKGFYESGIVGHQTLVRWLPVSYGMPELEDQDVDETSALQELCGHGLPPFMDAPLDAPTAPRVKKPAAPPKESKCARPTMVPTVPMDFGGSVRGGEGLIGSARSEGPRGAGRTGSARGEGQRGEGLIGSARSEGFTGSARSEGVSSSARSEGFTGSVRSVDSERGISTADGFSAAHAAPPDSIESREAEFAEWERQQAAEADAALMAQAADEVRREMRAEQARASACKPPAWAGSAAAALEDDGFQDSDAEADAHGAGGGAADEGDEGDTSEWWFYVAFGGEVKGPFTPFQMKGFYESGIVTERTRVRWLPVSYGVPKLEEQSADETSVLEMLCGDGTPPFYDATKGKYDTERKSVAPARATIGRPVPLLGSGDTHKNLRAPPPPSPGTRDDRVRSRVQRARRSIETIRGGPVAFVPPAAASPPAPQPPMHAQSSGDLGV